MMLLAVATALVRFEGARQSYYLRRDSIIIITI
jgi:hypothetical protein